MAKGFFENFPTMVYDNDGKGQYKEVVDIFRRVSLRNNLKNYIQMPLLQNIDGTQKPERLANLVHGDPNRNWLVMMMNDIENPYTDWFMGEEEFYKYMLEKYPNKFIELDSVYFDHDDDSDTPSVFQPFIPGEVLNTYLGTVVKYDPTLKIIVYTDSSYTVTTGDSYIGTTLVAPDGSTPSNTNWEKNDTFIIPSTDIGLSVTLTGLYSSSQVVSSTSAKSEIYAPHHIDVDGDVVTNWDYEFNLNEARSQVSVLNNDYIDRIEDEFKKRIT